MADDKEKTKKVPKNKGGRPTDFKEEYIELVYRYCLLGLIDKDLALLFDCSVSTLNKWKLDHPEFSESIKKGKEIADADVALSLRERALGYSHPDTHISNYQGDITVTPITKHYAPDTAAAIFWLKNRKPKLWREKQEISLKSDKPLQYEFILQPRKENREEG